MIPRLIFEMESTGDDDLEGMLRVCSMTGCEGVQVMAGNGVGLLCTLGPV